MSEQIVYRVLIIDDNKDIHADFIKLLTFKPVDPKIKILKDRLFSFKKNNLDNDNSSTNVLSTLKLPMFDIDTATQGIEGIEKVKLSVEENKPYALAFVDIRMPPGIDGIKTIQKIWKTDPNIQIVLCSAFSDYSWEETIRELGVGDNLLILKKPFDNTAARQLTINLTKKWGNLQVSLAQNEYIKNSIVENKNSLKRTISQARVRLEYQATHDSLTSLPNRDLLINHIQSAIDADDSTQFALIAFNLDRLSLINDTLSYQAGDKILQMTSKRIEEIVSDGDLLARLSGDEFVLFLSNIKNDQSIIKSIDNLSTIINRPYDVNSHSIRISASMGVTLYPKDGKNAEELLRNADLAMCASKNEGRSKYSFYEKTLSDNNRLRLARGIELHTAIQNHEFILYYQPQIDITSNRIIGVEALIRWQHPILGLVPPLEFIEIAEDSGLMVQIGEWVLRTACAQAKEWHNLNLPKMHMAVNISKSQLNDPNFIYMVNSVLLDTGLEAKYLIAELSENIIITNRNTIKVLQDLAQLGVGISFDDFGTGTSSLDNLRKVPVHQLKIDRSFVMNMHSSKHDAAIVLGIISMATDLNLEIIAEGVRTSEQLSFLLEHQCSKIQGYYFSKPLPNEALEAFVRKFETNTD